MAGVYLSAFLHHVRGLVGAPRAGPTEDEQLLERFVSRGDQAAFAALVERHGALVLGVCRRVLRHEQDAEDAFQAAFLVLARKAGSIRKRRSLGAWLHGVATRVARKARDSAPRQRGRGEVRPPVLHADPCDAACRAELRALLDDALRDVPEKYRSPLVLCYLQGRSSEQAARELGRPVGSMSRHLERGRQLLRGQLRRRGIVAPAALVAATLAGEAPAAVPDALGASALVPKSCAAGRAAVLAEGVLRTM